MIVEAYKTLSDDIKRKDYDETIKPKASPYTQQQYQQGEGDTSWQNKYKNSGYTYTRAKPNEKFYGDNREYNQAGGYTWQQDQEYQPPPPNQRERGGASIWTSFNPESVLVL